MDDDPIASAAGVGVPPGYVPLKVGGNFISMIGPVYGRRDGGRLLIGFRVEPRHTNPVGACHGGMLMTFADLQLPLASRFQANLEDRFLLTVNLTADFLAPAQLGAWVEGRTDVLKTTRKLVFAQTLITADSASVLRASGTFKLGPPIVWSTELDQLFPERQTTDG